MCKNLKMWLTDLLTDKRTDRRTDKRVAGGHYCWGVLLWPPQLGLGGKCDRKWKFKNVEKITSFSDAVTLTFDLRPWKVNQVRTLSLPMCIPNLRTIHPVGVLSYHVSTIAGGGRLRRKTITSPDPSDTGDIINKIFSTCRTSKFSHFIQSPYIVHRRNLAPIHLANRQFYFHRGGHCAMGHV